MAFAVPNDVTRLLILHPRIENPSLLFEKFLLPLDYGLNAKNKPEQKNQALNRLAECRISREAVNRTNELLRMIVNQFGEASRVCYARLTTPLAINLGEGLLENAGIALDRTYGVPYIPGSAFKGCCHHAAYWLQKEGQLDEGVVQKIFGMSADDTTAMKGALDFFPVYPVELPSIGMDILTPHGRSGDTERDPIPNKFPVVLPGILFAFVYVFNSIGQRMDKHLQGQCSDAMETILERAFLNGFGAKTAAGHGHFIQDADYERGVLENERQAQEARVRAEEEEREKAEKKRREEERVRQVQAADEANRKRNLELERQRLEALQQAGPEALRRHEIENLSKEGFIKVLKALPSEDDVGARMIIEVLKGKSEKKRKQILKDKQANKAVCERARILGIEL